MLIIKNLRILAKTRKKSLRILAKNVFLPKNHHRKKVKMKLFKRKMYNKMLQWKTERNGETALLIQGARRIGKSTLVEEFAKREYETYIMIDFSKASSEVMTLFEDLSDLNYIFLRLQLLYHTQLIERRSVIIFDEVQKQPLAREAIKHLVADRRYDYIETGSLISIKSNVQNIIIPSEETIFNMYPMDYEEFRWAMGDTATIPLLESVFSQHQFLGDVVHRKILRDFRLYMLVGGMPQAVSKLIQTNNFAEVDKIKRDILNLYRSDMQKLDSSGKATALFDAIPGQLSKNVSRYHVSSVIPGEKTDRVLSTIHLMEESMMVNVSYHVNDPNAGLALTKDINKYKMYTNDTGLFVTLAFMDKAVTENVIYEKLLNDKLSTNLGYVYENIIAQILKASGYELYYHTIQKDDQKGYYEVDFILPGEKICPIEVKSSGYKSHISLDKFSEKYSNRIKNKYIIYTKDIKKEGDLLYLPAYMTMFV